MLFDAEKLLCGKLYTSAKQHNDVCEVANLHRKWIYSPSPLTV